MMQKLAIPGYRVAPMYNDQPNGTIIGRVDDLNVMVAWDTLGKSFRYGFDLVRDAKAVTKEQIKYLRKGSPSTNLCTCKQHRTDGRQATEPDCPIHFDASAGLLL